VLAIDAADEPQMQPLADEDEAHSRELNLEASAYDRYLYRRLLLRAPRLKNFAIEHVEAVPTIAAMMEDLFLAFHRTSVRWADEDQVDPAYKVNRPFLERVLNSAAYNRLHPQSEGRADDSLLCLEAFATRFVDALNDEMRHFLSAEYDYHSARNQLAREKEEIEEFNASSRRARRSRPEEDDAEAALEKRRPEEMTVSQRKRRLDDIDSDLGDMERDYQRDYQRVAAAENFGANLREARLPDSLASADKQIRAFNEALSIWGVDAAGGGGDINLEDKLELFAKLEQNARLREVTALLGRLRFVAAAAHRQRPDQRPNELAEVKLGNDLARLLPTEIALLGDRVTETIFMRKFAERELMVYGLKGQPPNTRGPIIFCLDESRSMEGQRDITAKAIAMSMLSVARADARDLAIIHFSSADQLEINEFPAGRGRALDVVSVLSHFFDGGTDFDAPLTAAIDLSERSAAFEKADIVMVTDGEALIGPGTRQRLADAKEKRGTRLFAVCVGTEGNIFKGLADEVWSSVDLSAEADDPQLLRELVDKIHA